MSIETGDYILWFAHYGSIDWERHRGPLEEVVNYVASMDQEDMGSYDSHGIPLDLELVGTGIVENFFDLVRARSEELKVEREAYAQECQRRREERKAEGPTYSINLKPPPEMDDDNKHLWSYRRGVLLRYGLSYADLIAERDRLEDVFGRERISVTESK